MILLDIIFVFFLEIFKFFTFSSHIITLLTVLISHYKRSKYNTIEHIKILNDIDYRFNGLDTSFFKKLIEFFNFVFNCHF